MDEVMFVCIAAAIAVVGVIIGAQIQKICRFIIPCDFLTGTMIVAIASILVLQPDLIAWHWFVPYLIGYFCGYLVVGRTMYTMCIELPNPEHVRIRNRVFYEDCGITYIQEQNNRALFDRLIFGISHEIESNVPLSDDKVLSYDRPLFPTWEDRAIMIESIHTDVELKEGRFLKHKIYTTTISVAYGSSTTKMQLMYDISVLKNMQLDIIDLTAEIHRLQGETGPKMLEHAIQIDMAAKKTTPENRALALAKALKEQHTKIQELKGENNDA